MSIHHPSEEMLWRYAGGGLAEPFALLVAAHLTLCPVCRRQVRDLDAIGGALLENAAADPVSGDLKSRVLAALDRPVLATSRSGEGESKVEDADLAGYPTALRRAAREALNYGGWRRLGRGLEELRLLTSHDGHVTRIMRIAGGVSLPQHTHGGQECTLVLSGGFSDSLGHYVRGDVATADPTVDHSPVADTGEDCVCLAVTDAPLRLTGRFGRFLNPFVRL
jgi:putative transcriptional regulator